VLEGSLMSSSSAVARPREWTGSARRIAHKPVLVVLLVLVELIVWSGLQPQLAKAVTPPADANLGQQGWYKLEKHRLTDKSQLAVNMGNGNLVVQSTDFSISGTGLNFDLTRTYNSQGGPQTPDIGANWTTGLGPDVSLIDYQLNGNRTFIGPSGYVKTFVVNGSSWTTPAGIKAELTAVGANYQLKYHQSSEIYLFNGTGQLLSHADRNGNTISFTYTSGRLTQVTDTQGRALTITYTGSLITKVTDSTGRFAKYAYTGNLLTTYTDATNAITKYGYTNGLLSKITDPLNNVVNISIDSVTKRTQSVSYVTTGGNLTTAYGYTSGHATSTDPNTHVTTYDVDGSERVTKVTDALTHQHQSTYTTNDDAATFTNALTALTTLSHDSMNNLTSIQAPASALNQNPATTNLGYHANNQPFLPSSQTDPVGNCRAFMYDPAGNTTDVYDGQLTNCDNLTGGSHLSNAYQGDPGVNCSAKPGELCTTKDATPNHNQTNYVYDSNGNVTSIRPPSPLGWTTILPDALSRPSQVTNGKGQVTRYSYDKLDRIIQILYGGATSCTDAATCTTYQWDQAGNLTQRVDNTGTATFGYDQLNRTIRKSHSDSTVDCPGSNPAGLIFTFDGANNLTSYCDIAGTVNYTYDAANRLSNLAEPGGRCTAPVSLCTTFSYNDNDQRLQAVFPGGATQTLTYDGAGNQLTVVGKDSNPAHPPLTSFTYTYNNAQNDTARRQTMAEADPVATLTTTYTYDSSGRLTDADNPSTVLDYSYDANGNRCRTDGTACQGVSDPYQYNGANELTSSPGTSSYSYDGNGNQTASSAGYAAIYNPKNQTTSMTANGQGPVAMAYADADQTERTSVGSAPTHLTSSPLGVMMSKTNEAPTHFIRDDHGQLIGERTPDGNHWYYLTDALGSVVAVINGDGSTVGNRYGYDPYGQSTYSSGTVANPWRFASGYLDATGLYKFGARYNDPSLGRWTQQDSVGGSISNPATTNRYLYAGDGPTNNVDPSGRDFGSAIGAFAIGVGIGVVGCGLSFTGVALALCGGGFATAAIAYEELAPYAGTWLYNQNFLNVATPNPCPGYCS
jgi:RHS repeat-associated protein